MISNSAWHDDQPAEFGEVSSSSWLLASPGRIQAQGLIFDPLNTIVPYYCSNHQYHHDDENFTSHTKTCNDELCTNISSTFPFVVATQQSTFWKQIMCSNMTLSRTNNTNRDVDDEAMSTANNSSFSSLFRTTFVPASTGVDAANKLAHNRRAGLLPQEKQVVVNSVSDDESININHHVTTSRMTQIPNEFDVLCGRGKPIQGHRGNILLHKLVDLHMKHYISCQRESKRLLVAQILDAMKAKGMRFLKKDHDQDDKGFVSSSWIEIDDLAAKDKIGHCFRSRLPRAQRQDDF